jgi:hypothetical protein
MSDHWLSSLLGLLSTPADYEDYTTIIPYLQDNWLAEFCSKAPENEMVEVNCGGFRYLFDVLGERLIAA